MRPATGTIAGLALGVMIAACAVQQSRSSKGDIEYRNEIANLDTQIRGWRVEAGMPAQVPYQLIPFVKGKFKFGPNGRALALGETDGQVKMLAHKHTDRILGCHIVGARAGDLIAEVAVAIELGASAEDLARCSHAHPTLSEVVREAALDCARRSLHK